MIDLGLPSGTKWACCNVGAEKPEEKGDYYAWGQTVVQETYSKVGYEYSQANKIFFDIQGTEYDVAHVKWGGEWLMPNKRQIEELFNFCSYQWVTQNGVKGGKFTGSNSASVFLPVAGWIWNGGQNLPDYGCYWSSSFDQSDSAYAYLLEFYEGRVDWSRNVRSGGLSVRPVVAASSTPDGIAIDAINFPDENFRSWLLTQYYGQDDVLTEEEIASITSIDVKSKNISNLNGIEYFTELTYLNCGENKLTVLDVSNNIALTDLYCYNNQLTSLDVSNNTAMASLSCGDNQLTSLDVSNNTALTDLYCYNNQLTSLDVSNNTALAFLSCGDNQLTSLDVSSNTELREFICSYNQLTSLDVSNCTALWSLKCHNNQLTSLDVPNNTALMYLYCYNNQLASLDVLNCNALTELDCSDNQLTSLDVSNCTALWILDCSDNQLTSLYVSNCTALYSLICYNNRLKGTSMDALIASLPETDDGNFEALDPESGEEGNVVTKAQVAEARKKGWITHTTIYEEYEGSDPKEIEPIDEGYAVNIGDVIGEDTDLDGNVVGNVFYNINNSYGWYDPLEGCIVVSQPTDDSDIGGQDIFGENFKAGFTGIVFKVNEGKGIIKVEAETQGTMVLKVKFGDNDPIEKELDGKLIVSFPFNVSEPTYVYIYGGTNVSRAKGMRKAAGANALKIYGIEVTSGTDDIEIIDNGSLTNDHSPVYSLSGLRVDSLQQGINIVDGKKVLVK
ncbi:MAG: leucine-rich repeat domain-containing protein [Prevotella sp.]|nr:leucine-rich repeat domain-containing protein [Prevotella sp.]